MSRIWLIFVLAAWTPFVSTNPDVEAGNAALAAGNYDDALAAYDRAAKSGRVDPSGLAYDRGTAELRKAQQTNDPAEKARLFERGQDDLKTAAHSTDPRIRGDAAYNRGNSLMAQEKYADAAAAYKQALHENPRPRRRSGQPRARAQAPAEAGAATAAAAGQARQARSTGPAGATRWQWAAGQ